MAAPLLAEGTVSLIVATLKANFAAALSAVSSARANEVSLEEPKEYFDYEVAKMYLKPAVFVVCPDFDFRPETGQNFIYALAKVQVSLVVEDQTSDLVTRKLWRYASALFDILNVSELADPTQRLKLNPVVKRQAFSDTYTKKSESDESENVFTKEVVFVLEVVHQEKF